MLRVTACGSLRHSHRGCTFTTYHRAAGCRLLICLPMKPPNQSHGVPGQLRRLDAYSHGDPSTPQADKIFTRHAACEIAHCHSGQVAGLWLAVIRRGDRNPWPGKAWEQRVWRRLGFPGVSLVSTSTGRARRSGHGKCRFAATMNAMPPCAPTSL